MKTALVLGLALAANAYKTEQVETTVHIKGNNLHLKDLKDLIPHGIKFDDQADDEMFVAPRQEPGKPWRHIPYIMYDDEADNELHRAPTDMNGNRIPYRPGVKYDDEVDDELLIRVPPQVFADDELIFRTPLGEILKDGADKNKPHKLYRGLLGPVYLDEQNDDEYVTLPSDYIDLFRGRRFPIELQALRVDDELATLPYKDYTSLFKNLPKIPMEHQIQQADDELFHYESLPKNFKRMELQNDDELMSRPILPQLIYDDELALWHALPKEVARNPASDKILVALRADDEVDDELVLLKDLLKPDRHRPLDIVLPRDDELRVIEKAPRLRGGEVGRKDHTIILP